MAETRRYALTLDLQDDPALIAEYEAYHRPGGVWPEIQESIRAAGICALTIYRWETRLTMIIDVDETFSFEAKAARDAADPAVARWEALMWRFQRSLPGTRPGEKWCLMKEICSLSGD